MNASNRNAIVALVALASLTASAVAPAADHARVLTVEHPTLTVRLSDFNLSTPAGVGALYARLRGAAQTACGPSFALWYPQVWQNWKACYTLTLNRAVEQVNRPALTALHEQQVRGPLSVGEISASAAVGHGH